MRKLVVYIKKGVLTIDELRRLKQKFVVTYNEDVKADIVVEDTYITYKDVKINSKDFVAYDNISFDYVIELMLLEVDNISEM